MPASKVQLIGGVFQDAEGNVLANGYLKLFLSQDGNVSGVGQICSGVEIKVTLNASGSVDTTTAQSVWSNDQMSPVNSYYRVTGYTAAGQAAWGPNNQQVTGNGGTFDVGTWVPNVPISWTPPTTNPVLQTNEVKNGSQALLDLHAGSNVTLTDNGAGQVTIAASVPAPTSLQTAQSQHQVLVNQAAGVVSAGTWTLFTTIVLSASTQTVVGPTATAPMLYQAVTNGAANQQGGLLYETNALMTTGIFGTFKSRVGISSLSSVNFWIGLTDIVPASTGSSFNTSAPAANVIGFRLGVGETTWKCVCQTGAANQTVVDSLVTADTNLHVFSIQQSPAGTMKFYIDGNLVATISTNVPTSSTALRGFVNYINTTIGACTLNFSSLYWDSGF